MLLFVCIILIFFMLLRSIYNILDLGKSMCLQFIFLLLLRFIVLQPMMKLVFWAQILLDKCFFLLAHLLSLSRSHFDCLSSFKALDHMQIQLLCFFIFSFFLMLPVNLPSVLLMFNFIFDSFIIFFNCSISLS
jgi:hypothetical protein